MLRRDRIAQQIAVAQQIIALRPHAGFVAVVDVGEAGQRCELLEKTAARIRPFAFVSAFDRQQQDARHHTVLQLLDQDFLRVAGFTRQEGANVAAESSIAQDPYRGRQHQ